MRDADLAPPHLLDRSWTFEASRLDRCEPLRHRLHQGSPVLTGGSLLQIPTVASSVANILWTFAHRIKHQEQVVAEQRFGLRLCRTAQPFDASQRRSHDFRAAGIWKAFGFMGFRQCGDPPNERCDAQGFPA